MKKIFFLLFIVIPVVNVYSQNTPPCGTDQQHEHLLNANPQLRALEEQANEMAGNAIYNSYKAGVIKYIPVVFHVVHNYGAENITQEQINDQIRILNEDFRKKSGTNGGSSTNLLATDMEIEFRLAQYDPSGQPTDGVNRVQSSLTYNADDALKAVSYWPSDKYLNIWVVNFIKNNNSGTILGYAQFPWDRATQASTDGIIVRADRVGVIGTADASDAGRTLTHEIGHWLGLYHTFQNGCGSGQNCTTQGDRVCDTPPVANPNYGCVASINSCANDVPDLKDQTNNYMDYSDGSCMNMYTPGQLTRVNSMIQSYRSLIYSESNLDAAGINADGSYPVFTSVQKGISFNFNVPSINGTGWTSESHTIHPDTGWKLNTQIGHTDNTSMYIQNIRTNSVNTRASFSSPTFDISGFNTPTLSFYVAYAKRNTASADWLRVYVSDNFGRTEVLAKIFLANELQSASVNAQEFIPSGNSEWKGLSLDLSSYRSYKNMSVRFEFVNRKGNNIYLDDINVGEPLAIENVSRNIYDFNFYPNPVNGTGTVAFSLNEAGNVHFELYDICGRLVQCEEANYGTGTQWKEFNTASVKDGIYYLKLRTEHGSLTQKIIVSH